MHREPMQRLGNASLRGGIEWMCKAQPRNCIEVHRRAMAAQGLDSLRQSCVSICDGLATQGRAKAKRRVELLWNELRQA
uniref:Uncharacterized protein n=1 Tax=Ackermannviridae sp. TaxID=2831612 RepID=A0A8S5VJ15_9CAUD|nr:MAG TPA: hypothetical protein [Ackermannviridae sp.]